MILDYITSENNKFRCYITTTGDKTVPFVKGSDDIYLCGEVNQSFIITVCCNNPKVYGAKLYIDDTDVYGVKTFKLKGTFLGVKKGEGKYKEFVFKRTTFDETCEDDTLPSIRIEFFNTERRYFKPKKYRSKFLDNNQTSGKKFDHKPIVVSEGGRTVFMKKKFNNDDKKTDVVDFSRKIDTIEFRYSDYLSLELKGVISMDNLNYISLMPFDNNSKDCIIKILKKIIKGHNGLFLYDLENKFIQYTKKNLKDCFNLFNCRTVKDFIQSNYMHFSIDCDGYIMAKEYQIKSAYPKIKEESFI